MCTLRDTALPHHVEKLERRLLQKNGMPLVVCVPLSVRLTTLLVRNHSGVDTTKCFVLHRGKSVQLGGRIAVLEERDARTYNASGGGERVRVHI